MQLAFDEVAERKLSKAELGHLAEGRRRRRTAISSSSAAQSELTVGETVTVEAFEPGDDDQGRRDLDRQGLPGHDQAAQLQRAARVSHGSHNVRKPGSIGASATPSRVFKGMKMAGRMGGKRVTQLGLVVHEVDVERNLLLVKGSVPGPKSGLVEIGRTSVMAAPKAPVLGGSKAKDVTLEEAVFGAELKPHLVHETVRAELNARRAGTRGAKSRGLVAGGRAKPWRQKGTGRARAGHDPRAAVGRAAASPSRRACAASRSR